MMVEEVLAQSRVDDIYREIERKQLREERIREVRDRLVAVEEPNPTTRPFRALARLFPAVFRL